MLKLGIPGMNLEKKLLFINPYTLEYLTDLNEEDENCPKYCAIFNFI